MCCCLIARRVAVDHTALSVRMIFKLSYFLSNSPLFRPFSNPSHPSFESLYPLATFNMLSNLLTSTYLQYKTDTDVVASWLASTASHCGFKQEPCDTPCSSQKPQPPVSQRLKGNARKEAQKAQRASSASTDVEPAKEKYKITVK